MDDSKFPQVETLEVVEERARSDKTCCEKVMSCIADFFECDRKLYPLDRPAYEQPDWENFDQSTTYRTKRHATHPLDIKLQSDDRLDENRLASCCTLQWWIDFLCCKSDEHLIEEQPSVNSEKQHIKLNEKTIEDLDYEKDRYALDPKESEVGSNPVGVAKPRTASRQNDSRSKLNILMHDGNPDEQLDHIDLEKNSSSISPVSVEKVEVRPWRSKGKRSESGQGAQKENDDKVTPKSSNIVSVNEESINKPLTIYKKNGKVEQSNGQPTNNDALIFVDDVPADESMKITSGKDRRLKVADRQRQGGITQTETRKKDSHREEQGDYANTKASNSILYEDEEDMQPPVRNQRQSPTSPGKKQPSSMYAEPSRPFNEPNSQYHTLEEDLSRPLPMRGNSFEEESPTNDRNYNTIANPSYPRHDVSKSFDEGNDMSFQHSNSPQPDVGNPPPADTENVGNKKKKKKKNITIDTEKRIAESLMVSSNNDQPQETIVFFDQPQGQQQLPTEDYSPQPRESNISPAADLNDVKKRKRNKFNRQEEAPAEEIVLDQLTDVKKKRRARRQQRQDYVQEIVVNDEQEQPVERKPRRKQDNDE